MNFIKKLFQPVDMTVGTPWVDIALFTVPMILGNLAQQLYNTVDSIIVGKYVGDNALAAVGGVGPIINLLIVLFIGISVGAGISVSQYFGARKRRELSCTIGNCITLSLIAVVIVMVLGSLLARPIVHLLGTPDSIEDWCVAYLRIVCLGIIGTSFFNILSGILRGLGDSMSALLYLLVATLVNIILDLVFVVNLNMGVKGVALATVIAQGLSAVLCLYRLSRLRDFFDLKMEYLRPMKQYTSVIIKLGVPSGITQAIMSTSMIVVQALINSFGEVLMAANVILMRVDAFCMLPSMSFGNGMTTFAGQNIGAGKLDRVSKGSRQGTIMAVCTSTVITILLLLFGRYLMGIFTNTASTADLAMSLMRIMAPGYIAVSVNMCLSGIMRGAGDATTPMWISLIQSVLLRMPLAYIMVFLSRSAANPAGDYRMIWISLVTSWCCGCLLNIFFYVKGKWRNKAITH